MTRRPAGDPGPMLFPDPTVERGERAEPGRAADPGPMALALDAVVPMAQESESVDVPPTAPASPATAPNWAARALWGGLLALIALGLGLDAADTVARAFTVAPWLGWGTLGLIGVSTLGLVGLIGAELRGLARLRRLWATRAAVARFGDGADTMMIDSKAVGALVAPYRDRGDVAGGVERFKAALADAHDMGQANRLFEREVLAPLDDRAIKATIRAARDGAVLTAVLPLASLDMLVMAWRNIKLTREIAALYGARPGYWGALALFRRVLAGIAAAGVGEGLHHVAASALGGTLTAAVSANLGKGLVNGMLTARVGLAAIEACRPIPFADDRRPALAKVAVAVLEGARGGESHKME